MFFDLSGTEIAISVTTLPGLTYSVEPPHLNLCANLDGIHPKCVELLGLGHNEELSRQTKSHGYRIVTLCCHTAFVLELNIMFCWI